MKGQPKKLVFTSFLDCAHFIDHRWKLIDQLQEVIDLFDVINNHFNRVIVISGPLTYQVKEYSTSTSSAFSHHGL